MVTKELSGTIAFVTGSGRGLARTMAVRLAELRADVAIHDVDWTAPAKYGESADLGAVAKDIEKHGVCTAAVTGNIGDKAAVASSQPGPDQDHPLPGYCGPGKDGFIILLSKTKRHHRLTLANDFTKKASDPLVARAWSRMTITSEASLEAFQAFVTNAQQAGFLRGAPDLSRLIETP